MKYVIGIDQGSTKTHTAISDLAGNILATYMTGGAEHHCVGIKKQMGLIDESLAEILKLSGVSKDELLHIYCGLGGADFEEEYLELKRLVRMLGYSNEISVANDCQIAFRGGSQKGVGAIICVGSGTNCAVRSPSGEEFVYGYYVEDEIMGATAIGQAALTLAYQSAMGRIGFTALTERLLEHFSARTVDELLRIDILEELRNEEKKSLAPLMFECAYDGDLIAAEYIKDYGIKTAGLVNARAKIFGMEMLDFDMVLSGSVFKGPGSLLSDAIRMEIHTVCPKAKIIPARYEPVVGAVICALEASGHKGDFSNIETSGKKHNLLRQIRGQHEEGEFCES